ncbi:hypothetical protein ELI_0557 [Eubacterium callanderi]|uniref:Uncharacterized protein n=1 Tax=Eubacterium callanderi TaxID=53442 RepID=E3GIT8_9FIRM|nr:hypothetical protein ELI_0557 [Eubacterium callanderi]
MHADVRTCALSAGGKTGYDRAMKRTGRSEKQKFRRSNKHDEFKN